MSRNTLGLSQFDRGGLYQVTSLCGGSTRFSLACLENIFQGEKPEPASSQKYLWISDEGYLYPQALHAQFQMPLTSWLLAKPKSALEAWKVALEAAQSGLFGWVLARPSQGCETSLLRKIQLAAEKTQTRLMILGRSNLPHWMFRWSVAVEEEKNHEENSLPPYFQVRTNFGRSLFFPHAEGESLGRKGAVS